MGNTGRLPSTAERKALLQMAVVATLVLLLALGLTAWAGRAADMGAVDAARQRFDFKVQEAVFSIRQRLLAYEEVLRGAAGLFGADGQVTRQAWHAYVGALALSQTYPGIRGIGYVVHVAAPELPGYEARVRAEGFPAYAVHPLGQRAEYVPVIYLEPFDWRNQRAFGYDVWSEPVRHEALARARDSGQPAATGKVRLVQETNRDVQDGFLIFLPVYRQHATPPQSVAMRRAGLLGYVYAPFRMNDLMQGTLGHDALPNLRLQVFDGAPGKAAALEQRMYDSSGAGQVATPTAAFRAERAFVVGGRTWTLRFSSLPAFNLAIDHQKTWLILVAGALASLLVTVFVVILSLSRIRARQLTQSNRELEAARQAAEEANRAKDQFLANVSHELRTPLTLILAPLAQLQAEPGQAAVMEPALACIERNAVRLLNLVNDLLDFAKVDAGMAVPLPAWLDMADLTAAVVADAGAAAARKGCTLACSTDPAVGMVYQDGRQLEKILLNLLSNALKFTPAGGRIGVELAANGPDRFELRVCDSGIGIPPEQQQRVFGRFQQADGSASRQYGGTGIGLALVKDLATQMGGQVTLVSQPGCGACFTVNLPRVSAHCQPPAAVSADAARAQAGRGSEELALRRSRLEESAGVPVPVAAHAGASAASDVLALALVVDDNADMSRFIAGLLAAECRVLCAGNGLEAWHLLETQAVDVVVTDVMMPELDGLGLLARIKQDARLADIPVILVTARGGCETVVSGLESGADDYVLKPFAPEELRARVRAALRMSALQRQFRDKAQEAGLAMQATCILHNLGNALSGVTVLASELEQRMMGSRVSLLHEVAALLHKQAAQLSGSAAQLPVFVEQLAEHVEQERLTLLREMARLKECVGHAQEVVACQQQALPPRQARREMVSVSTLFESALQLSEAAFGLKGIEIERHYDYTGAVEVERHKLLQIIVNLLANAAKALCDGPAADKRIRLTARSQGGRVCLEVGDNGVGMASGQLRQVFNFGFSTRGHGHGYGLHLSANWARELGGSLRCHSAGIGCGATFTLELPAPRAE